MNKKGSVLVYTMIVLSLILAMAIGLASVALVQRRSTLTSAKSIEAFQVADSAAEKYLEQIYDDTDPHTTPKDFGDCSGNKIDGDFDSEREYQVFFYENDSADPPLNCNDTDTIGIMKVIGFYGGTTRAIEITIGTITP